MSDTTEETLPQSPIEILQSVGAIVEQLQPELVRALGNIATIHEQGAEQDWVHSVADSAERVQNALGIIFSAVNDVSTRPIKDESKVTEIEETPEPEQIELTLLEQEILEFAKSGCAFRIEEMRKQMPSLQDISAEENKELKTSFSKIRARIAQSLVEQGIEASWEEEGKARGKNYRLVTNLVPEPGMQDGEGDEPEIISTDTEVTETVAMEADQSEEIELEFEPGLSANEQSALKKSIEFLQGHEERVSLRLIISAVFGKSRLKRGEEARLRQVLDMYVDRGILRSHGKTYGYKSPEDQSMSQRSMDGLLPVPQGELSKQQQEIVNFVTQRAILAGGELNVGEIVRSYFNVQQLPREEFTDFVSVLNDLADKGYLIHAHGSPWYGVHQTEVKISDNEKPKKVLPSITTPVILVKQKTHEESEEVSSVSAPQPTTVTATKKEKPKKPEVESGAFDQYGLSEREVEMTIAILNSATKGEWFQQKQVDISGIKFASDGARRQAFTKLTQRLLELGLIITEGSRGGKKYQITDKLLPHKQTEVSAPTTEQTKKSSKQPEKYYESDGASTEQDSANKVELSPRQQAQMARRAARFTLSLTQGITSVLEERENHKEKVSVVTRLLMDNLDISREESRDVIRQLVEAGHFYFNGHRRGTRLLSLDKPAEEKPKNKNASVNETRAKSMLTEEDIVIAGVVFDRLLGLTHVQQGIPMKAMIRDMGIDQAHEESARRSIRRIEEQGYVLIETKPLPTRSPHSRKVAMPVVKLRDQELKERLRIDKASVMAELQELAAQK